MSKREAGEGRQGFAAALPEAVPEASEFAREARRGSVPKSRERKKHVGAYVDPAFARYLKQYVASQDTSLQALVTEALEVLLFDVRKVPEPDDYDRVSVSLRRRRT